MRVAPAALALFLLAFPPSAQAGCEPQGTHAYAGGTHFDQVGGFFGLALTVDSSVRDCDGDFIPGDVDGDLDAGLGAAFLPADHHTSDICVEDDALGHGVGYIVGADGDGDGLVTPEPPDRYMGTLRGCNDVGFPPGVDGGWWVYVLSPPRRAPCGEPRRPASNRMAVGGFL